MILTDFDSVTRGFKSHYPSQIAFKPHNNAVYFFTTRKLHELFQKNFIEYTYSTFFFSRISEDVKALEKIENLWRDTLTAAVNNHAEMTGVKENTDTESSGGVKYSKAEKTL